MCSREPVSSIEQPAAGSRAAPAAPAAPAWRNRRRLTRMRARRLAERLVAPRQVCPGCALRSSTRSVLVPITHLDASHRSQPDPALRWRRPLPAAQTPVPARPAACRSSSPRRPTRSRAGRSATTPRTGPSAATATVRRRRSYPHELDPRAVDPAAPNPLVGTKWFVDRMEPAYTPVGALEASRQGRRRRRRSGSSRANRASAGSGASPARACRRRCAASSTGSSATSRARCR